jgi:hypothetical protein
MKVDVLDTIAMIVVMAVILYLFYSLDWDFIFGAR